MSLFGSSASGGRSSSKNLVEFRAGKMTLKGTTVTADKRKGLVYVQQSDDALTHFCWKDRTTGKVEDDLIIFPDDCEFKRVPQCTTGRVYILKFKTSSRKFFFWMQEPKTEKDEENCKKVNDSLNNPQASGQSSGGSLGGMDQLGHGNLQELFANMDQEQIMQLMASGGLGGGLGGLSNILSGGGGRQSSRTSNRSQTSSSSTRSTTRPSTTTATTTAPATERASVTPAPTVVTPAPAVPAATPAATDAAGTPGLQLSQLQNILSQMGVQPGSLANSEPVDLSKAITPDVMIPILANAEVQERLKPYLPQGESIPSTAEELRATVKSAQFRQAMGSFSEALATGQLGPVLKQFGLPVSAQEAAAKGDVEGFAKAMQESEAKSGDKKSDKEEDMVVDQ